MSQHCPKRSSPSLWWSYPDVLLKRKVFLFTNDGRATSENSSGVQLDDNGSSIPLPNTSSASAAVCLQSIGTLSQSPQQSSCLGVPFIAAQCQSNIIAAATDTVNDDIDNSKQCHLELKNTKRQRRCQLETINSVSSTSECLLSKKDTLRRLCFTTLTHHLSSISSDHPISSAVDHCVIMDGLRFGADWVIYKGDPSAIHSERLVHCFDICSTIQPRWIVGANRTAAGVNKQAILSIIIQEDLVKTMIQGNGNSLKEMMIPTIGETHPGTLMSSQATLYSFRSLDSILFPKCDNTLVDDHRRSVLQLFRIERYSDI